MFSKICCGVSSLKGGMPVVNSYAMMPSAHQSTCVPARTVSIRNLPSESLAVRHSQQHLRGKVVGRADEGKPLPRRSLRVIAPNLGLAFTFPQILRKRAAIVFGERPAATSLKGRQ
jgi:hypothetical protein